MVEKSATFVSIDAMINYRSCCPVARAAVFANGLTVPVENLEMKGKLKGTFEILDPPLDNVDHAKLTKAMEQPCLQQLSLLSKFQSLSKMSMATLHRRIFRPRRSEAPSWIIHIRSTSLSTSHHTKWHLFSVFQDTGFKSPQPCDWILFRQWRIYSTPLWDRHLSFDCYLLDYGMIILSQMPPPTHTRQQPVRIEDIITMAIKFVDFCANTWLESLRLSLWMCFWAHISSTASFEAQFWVGAGPSCDTHAQYWYYRPCER